MNQSQAKDLIDLIVPLGEFSAVQMNPVLTFLNQFTNYTTVDPTANDDETQYYIGMRSTWYNSVTGNIYICIDDTATAAVWLNITPATNANSASFVNITKANLIAAVNGGTVSVKTQYRITDSTQGIIRVFGVSTGAIDTLGFKEGSWDGITYVNGEIGLYNISTDVFTVNTGAPSLQNVYNTGNTVNTWDLRMISTSGGQIGIVKNANFSGSTETIAFGDAANASATVTRGVSIGTNANSSAAGNDRVALGKFSGTFGDGSNVNTMGYEAGRRCKASNVNAFGFQASYSTTTLATAIDYINAIGYKAAIDNSATNVNAIGKEAAKNNQVSGINLNAIGDNAAEGNFGADCNFLGGLAGNINGGSKVIGIGKQAAVGNQGSNSIAIGEFSLLDNSGSNAIAIGKNAGVLNTKAFGVFIGNNAGYDTTSGTGNTLTGAFVISNQNLPIYSNSTIADSSITVVNGAVAGNTYLYYNQLTKAIGAVRL